MSVSASVVTVSTTVTRLDSDPGDRIPGSSFAVYNAGSAVVYIGGAGVTADTAATGGFPLAASASITVDLEPGEKLYGIVASGTVTVNVLAVGV